MSHLKPWQVMLWRWLGYAFAITLILFTLALEFFRWFFSLFSPGRISPANFVRNAKLEPYYATRDQMHEAVWELKYDRYGLTSFSSEPQADGSILYGTAIEVPRAWEERYVVYRSQNGGYVLADDFLCSEDLPIIAVDLEEGELVYKDYSGTPLLRRPLLRDAPDETT